MAWIPAKESSGDEKLAALLAPQRLADLERMVEQATARAEVQARRFVLFALPTDADTQVDTASGENVERRQLLGEHDRSSQRGKQDVRAQTNMIGARRYRGEHGQRFEPVPIGTRWLPPALDTAGLGSRVGIQILTEHHMVGHHHAIDAGLVGGTREIENAIPIAGILGRERGQ